MAETTMTAREARNRFNQRRATLRKSTWLMLAGIPFFIALVAYTEWHHTNGTEPSLGLVILIVVLCVLCLPLPVGCVIYIIEVFLVLRRPPRLFCPSRACGAYIPAYEPWVCAHCKYHNYNTTVYSFLNRCESCEAVPSGYECPRCFKVFALDDVKADAHPARAIPQSSSSEATDEAKAKREAKKERLKDGIELNKLLAEHARSVSARRQAENQARPRTQATRTPREKLEEDLAVQRDHTLALDEVLARARAEAKERFRDDSKALADYLAWLENEWKERAVRMLEGV